MGEETVKRKVRYAKKKARDILIRTGHKIIPSDNSDFCDRIVKLIKNLTNNYLNIN